MFPAKDIFLTINHFCYFMIFFLYFKEASRCFFSFKTGYTHGIPVKPEYIYIFTERIENVKPKLASEVSCAHLNALVGSKLLDLHLGCSFFCSCCCSPAFFSGQQWLQMISRCFKKINDKKDHSFSWNAVLRIWTWSPFLLPWLFTYLRTIFLK